MRPVHAVLLDLDGTLLDHDAAAGTAFMRACAQWLPALDASGRTAALAQWRALDARYIRMYLDGEMTFQEQRRARVRGILDAYGGCDLATADLDTAFATYLREYEVSWGGFADVVPAMRLLGQAPGGVAVLSNGDRSHQKAKLAALGLERVPRLFVPEDLGASKPQPGSFLGACTAMAWNPADVVYIGDSLDGDAEAAVRAGLVGCWLERHPTGRAGIDPRILRVSSLLDLCDLIEWC